MQSGTQQEKIDYMFKIVNSLDAIALQATDQIRRQTLRRDREITTDQPPEIQHFWIVYRNVRILSDLFREPGNSYRVLRKRYADYIEEWKNLANVARETFGLNLVSRGYLDGLRVPST